MRSENSDSLSTNGTDQEATNAERHGADATAERTENPEHRGHFDFRRTRETLCAREGEEMKKHHSTRKEKRSVTPEIRSTLELQKMGLSREQLVRLKRRAQAKGQSVQNVR